MNNKISLNKWLSQVGIASRRKTTELIKNNQVSVNNHIVNQPFILINPESDIIKMKGRVITQQNHQKEYYLLYKPEGYVSAVKSDSSNSPPVTSLIRSSQRLYPIGRLDINSQGLLILTNDGELTHQLTHPKFHIKKYYQVEVAGHVTSKKIDQLEKGIQLSDTKTRPSTINLIQTNNKSTILEFVIAEGKHRQIRRMCAAADLHVKKLIRTRINDVTIGNLKPGEYRKLSLEEVINLKTAKAEP